ncbi:MAG: ribosome-associated translation inhibitor RaiA [Chthoniobacterales bacterium]
MTNLPIHITTHHLRLSDSLRQFVRKKIAPVTRFAQDALAAEIVLRRHGGAATRFSASARLALPGRDIHGRAVDPDAYVAIGKLVAKLARLLRKRKTRLAKVFEHPGRGAITQLPVASPAREESPDLLALPPRFRDREGGQEMRVFGFRRGDPFAIINQRTSS